MLQSIRPSAPASPGRPAGSSPTPQQSRRDSREDRADRSRPAAKGLTTGEFLAHLVEVKGIELSRQTIHRGLRCRGMHEWALPLIL